ncbi:MAG: hypothetical protein RID91_13455 [Azospirillaceae bacterium]
MRLGKTEKSASQAQIADDGALVDGADWIKFDRIGSEGAHRQSCDPRYRALLDTYQEDPFSLSEPETLLSLGMSGRVGRLRLLPGDGGTFPGQRFAFVRCPDPLAPLTRPIGARALARAVVQPALIGRPSHFLVTGELEGEPAYLALSVLPLRPQEGQIRELLLPFQCKLVDIPSRLRQEFFARHF